MGNQRQQLKDRLATDLKIRMEGIQSYLTQLKRDQESFESSCTQAKSQIQKAADLMIEQLTKRKLTLLRELDVLAQKDSKFFQEKCQAAYLNLGSLQSTLLNLDSFDDSQLMNLKIPDIDPMAGMPVLQVKIDVTCQPLLEKIDEWGRLADTNDGRGGNALEPNFSKDSAEENFNLVSTLELIESEANPSSFENKCCIETQEKWVMEHWLSAKQSDNEGDEFEMVSMEPENSKDSLSREDSVVPDLDENPVSEMTDDSSSIICVKTGEDAKTTNAEDEYCVWLKPKKVATNMNNTEGSGSIPVPLVPLEMIQKPRNVSSSSISSKSRLLDFPGLRMDPRCWLHKKSKASHELFKLSTELAMNMSEKEIIPPSYAALPYPFWLKRC